MRRVFANIDPVWGSAADGDRCESLVREYYPEADIARPATPSFGQAVKSVWGKTGELPVFHMEDDWAALASITPDMVLPHLEPDVGMVALAQKARGPRDADFVKRAKRIRVLGVAVGRKLVNGYGTSPRFIAAGLAARYAELMNPRLDPEKQVYTDSNKRLSKLQEKFRCRQIWARTTRPRSSRILAVTGGFREISGKCTGKPKCPG